MKLLHFKNIKIFLTICFLVCISMITIEVSMHGLIIANNKLNEKYDIYLKNELFSKDTMITVDENEIKFDRLVKTYCNVEIVHNITEYCLLMLQKYDLDKLTIEYNAPEKILYHTYWQPDSIQDLNRTKLIIWSKNLYIVCKIKKTFIKYIKAGILEFRSLDAKLPELCSTGIFNYYEKCQSIFNKRLNGSDVVKLSDFVRFLILYKYGGLYVDGDVLFLRDMKPFWNKNFVYRWSNAYSYNTAIMGLRKGHGEFIEKLYGKIIRSSKSILDAFHPLSIKHAVASLNQNNIFNYGDLEVFNSVLFDSAWLCFDNGDITELPNTICCFSDFYDHIITRQEFIDNGGKFFSGAFTYHIHLNNCGSCKIRNDSYFSQVENYLKSKLL